MIKNKNMKNKIYIAKYSTGEYEDYTEHIVFATFDEDKAIKWCDKFEKTIKRCRDFYGKYYASEFNLEKFKTFVNRNYRYNNIGEAFYEKTEIR